jgi:ubiquinone/menaquinone biosynthesis C-methylase UbiE
VHNVVVTVLFIERRVFGRRMQPVLQYLQRAFWSQYGRFVWDAQEAPWKAPQIQHIVETLQARQVVSREHVLDAGCGTGDYAIALAKAGFQVTGVDYAVGMLSRAQVKVLDESIEGVSFQQMDLNTQLAFPNMHLDHIINISVLQVTAHPAFTLGELWRVLKPGGTLVLLHVPKPESHDLPLREIIKHRVGSFAARSLWKTALVVVKAWAERTGNARYWTAGELEQMLKACQFDVLSVDHGPPIVIMAGKPITGHNTGESVSGANQATGIR